MPPPGPWKHGPIPVIGLVGGIGSGKSAVAARLAELGAFVIDADTVGHALLSQRPVLERIVARFGPRVLAPSATEGEPQAVDRAVLGAIVFADPVALESLETIVHPWMRRTFDKAIARVARRGEAPALVLDAAILYEAGWDTFCDRVLFVDAPRPVRLARLQAQRGWDEPALAAREASQWPLDRKRARADAVLSNAGPLVALADEVDRVWESIRTPPPSPARRANRPVEEPRPGPPGRFRKRGSLPGRPPRPRGR